MVVAVVVGGRVLCCCADVKSSATLFIKTTTTPFRDDMVPSSIFPFLFFSLSFPHTLGSSALLSSSSPIINKKVTIIEW